MPNNRLELPVIKTGAQSSTAPEFEKIAILGLGLIGGSIAIAARSTWPTGLVIGVDEKSVLEQAMVLSAIDVASDDPVVIAEADLVILAAPVRVNIRLLGELAQNLPGNAVVTDVSSTKRVITEASKNLPGRLRFVGGHPLGGAPRGGIEHARPDLFQKRPWIFTPTDDTDQESVEKLQKFVTALGAEPFTLSPSEHDRVLAFLSHVPQLTASVLMHIVGEAVGDSGLSLSGRGLADTTRLATSPASIWRDICLTNTDEVREALDVLISELELLREDLSTGDDLVRIFESAGKWRRLLAQK